MCLHMALFLIQGLYTAYIMSDFNFLDNDDVEQFLLERIQQGDESVKLDFKTQLDMSDNVSKTKITKCLSAIANSDDNEFQGYGFIVIGFNTSTTSFVDNVCLENLDPTQAAFEQFVAARLDEVPKFRLISFLKDGENWGAIVIPPSQNQPHIFKRSFNNLTPKVDIREGDWFVREGSTTRRGLIKDFQRICAKKDDGDLKVTVKVNDELSRKTGGCILELVNQDEKDIEIISIKSSAWTGEEIVVYSSEELFYKISVINPRQNVFFSAITYYNYYNSGEFRPISNTGDIEILVSTHNAKFKINVEVIKNGIHGNWQINGISKPKESL